MRSLIAGLLAASLLLGSPSSNAPAAEPVSVLASLPDGLVKDILSRMPPAQRAAIEAVALEEVRKVHIDGQGPGGIAGAEQVERLVGTRLALLTAANIFQSNSEALAAWRVEDASELRAAAMAPEVASTPQGRSLLETVQGLRTIRKLLLATPYAYHPTTPCDEILVSDPDRLDICVDRKTFKSVVGLAWPNSNGQLVIGCTGQLISKTMVLTADHCFDNKPQFPVVLTHYTSGTDQALLADGKTVLNVRRHQVQDRFRGTTQAIGGGLRGFDLAILKLAAPVPFDGFPVLASGLPDPVTFTVGGWGPSDVRPVQSIALEVTVISPQSDLRVIEPTLRAWAATPTAGGGICHADSGGPLFGGMPDTDGASKMRLVGLVAGGNLDCRSGDQVMTDLTRREAVDFICGLAPGVPNCRQS